MTLEELYYKMIKEYGLETDEWGRSHIPGDNNKFLKLDGWLLTYGLTMHGNPYISVAQTISCKYIKYASYVNFVRFIKMDDNTEKILRMYIETTIRRYKKIMMRLKNDYEQEKLNQVQEDF